MEKIIDFNEALQKAKQQETQEDAGECPHCTLKSEWIIELLQCVPHIIMSSDVEEEILGRLTEFYNEMYEDAYEDGKRAAYSDIHGYAEFCIDLIDGVEED